MSCFIARSALLFSLSVSVAWAGVIMGGSGPGPKVMQRDTTALAVKGALKAIRWTSHTGRSVTRPTTGPTSGPWTVQAPAGEWVEVTLIFDGPVLLSDALGHAVKAELGELTLPLDWPVQGETELSLDLDLDAPAGLWSAGPTLRAGDPLLDSLSAAGVVRVDSESYSD